MSRTSIILHRQANARRTLGRRLADVVGSGERSRPDQNEGALLPALDAGLERGLEIGGWQKVAHVAALWSAR